jgi:DMSO/TMAO reductase YedYZ molybdopterin-dependent catalytic subunit
MTVIRTVCLAALLAPIANSLAAEPREAKAPQAQAEVILSVSGEVPRSLELTAADIARLPRKKVRAREHGGREAEFEGVPLVEIINSTGIHLGSDLRGRALANYLLVEAADGYKVVFALPELDPDSTDRVVLLADRRDGKPLDEKHGPLRIVVPDEKRHSRWVRQVRSLKLKRG